MYLRLPRSEGVSRAGTLRLHEVLELFEQDLPGGLGDRPNWISIFG